jgi:hypothetical protein
MKGLKKVVLPIFNVEDDRFAKFKLSSIYYAVAEIGIAGDFAEFGVHKGRCARFMEMFLTPDRKLHLFDSFEGLPEEWVSGKWKKGAFKLEESKIPKFNPKTTMVYKGWFKDTLPTFCENATTPLAFIHMDADLYSSTMDVFIPANRLIVPGSIILFDEYVMKDADDEHRALEDWASKFDRKYEYLWRSHRSQVCIRVTN